MNKKTITKAGEVLEGQVSALAKRLESGKPLTAAQVKFLQSAVSGEGTGEQSAFEALDVCRTDGELARRLGVQRQVISWHRGRAGSPDSMSVVEWRKYLVANGKIKTTAKMAAASRSESALGFSQSELDAIDHGIALLFYDLGEAIPHAVIPALEAVGFAPTQGQADEVALMFYGLLAHIADECCTRATGEALTPTLDRLPEAIIELRKRVENIGQLDESGG